MCRVLKEAKNALVFCLNGIVKKTVSITFPRDFSNFFTKNQMNFHLNVAFENKSLNQVTKGSLFKLLTQNRRSLKPLYFLPFEEKLEMILVQKFSISIERN